VASGESRPGIDLSGRDLRGQDLSGMDLCDANLTGANLTAAGLVGRDLSRAVLRDAVLIDADLRGAMLCGADLTDADFTRANLVGVDLTDLGAGRPRSLHRMKLIGAYPVAQATGLLEGAGHSIGWLTRGASPWPAIRSSASNVLTVAWHPAGDVMATGHADGSVRLWDVDNGQEIRRFEGHTQGVLSVAFSPDGRYLAAGCADGTVTLWDALAPPETARVATLFSTPDGWVACTPDGRYRRGGDISGSFWHVIGLCRFEPGELDEVIPDLRLPDHEPLLGR
jgi:hypothetical protein